MRLIFSSGGRGGRGLQQKYALVRWYDRVEAVPIHPKRKAPIVCYDLSEPTEEELAMATRCTRLAWTAGPDQYFVIPLEWIVQVVHIFCPPCGEDGGKIHYVNKYFWGSHV